MEVVALVTNVMKALLLVMIYCAEQHESTRLGADIQRGAYAEGFVFCDTISSEEA
jgi:hypothetical protein